MAKFVIPKKDFAAVLLFHRIGDPLSGKEPISDGLKCHPQDFEKSIRWFKRKGYSFISIDTLADMMSGKIPARPKSICLTFDDGYRDNLTDLLPIAEKYQLPFCVYVATNAPEGHLFTWWNTLEELLFKYKELKLSDGTCYPSATMDERWDSFWKLRAKIIALAKGKELEKTFKQLFKGYEFDLYHYAKEQYLTWDEIKKLDAHPLCTIGAHTCSHMAMDVADISEMRAEMQESLKCFEKHLGHAVHHFAYPFGLYNANALQVMREFYPGIRTFRTTDWGFVSSKTDLFLIPCIPNIEKILCAPLFDFSPYPGRKKRRGIIRLLIKKDGIRLELLKAMTIRIFLFKIALFDFEIKISIGENRTC